MNVDTLTSLIDNFRSLTQAGSISPETVGSILQKIADALSQAVVEEAVRELQSWRTVVAALPNYIASITPGQETDTGGLMIDAEAVNLLSGTHALSNLFEIPKATEEHSGLMTATTMRKFNGHSEVIMRNFSNINLLRRSVEQIEDSVDTLAAQTSNCVMRVQAGEADANSVILQVYYNDSASASVQLTPVEIPAATVTAAGVMTPQMLDSLNTARGIAKSVSNAVMDVQLGDSDANSVSLTIYNNSQATQSFQSTALVLPTASTTQAGVMTASQVGQLESLERRIIEVEGRAHESGGEGDLMSRIDNLEMRIQELENRPL